MEGCLYINKQARFTRLLRNSFKLYVFTMIAISLIISVKIRFNLQLGNCTVYKLQYHDFNQFGINIKCHVTLSNLCNVNMSWLWYINWKEACFALQLIYRKAILRKAIDTWLIFLIYQTGGNTKKYDVRDEKWGDGVIDGTGVEEVDRRVTWCESQRSQLQVG